MGPCVVSPWLGFHTRSTTGSLLPTAGMEHPQQSTPPHDGFRPGISPPGHGDTLLKGTAQSRGDVMFFPSHFKGQENS